jgi:TP901 family phage tail tape measure protein
MAAGYEARARITADVSGFVAGARAVANASNVATAAIKSLSTQLLASQRASNQAAQNMRTFSQAASNVSRSQQQNAQAASQAAQSAANMAAAYNQGAAAANRSAQAQNSNAQAQRTASTSLQAMGRELNRLRNEQERYQALLAQGQRLTRDQAESYAQIQTRLGQLTRDYIRLNSAERETVTTSRLLAQANRLATQGIQEHAAANVRLEQTGRLTHAQLQRLAREMERLSQMYARLNASAQQSGGATSAQRRALSNLQEEISRTRTTYQSLDEAQRRTVDQMREFSRTADVAAATGRRLRQGFSEAEQGARGLDVSLWSLRAAVGEVEGLLYGLQSAAIRVSSALWENFSTQEMAIAQIARVSQATVSELDTIVDAVRNMSREIPIAFEELAEITKLGSQVGVANEYLVEFTETVALFAATSEVTADETSTLLARIMQMADVPQDEVMNLGSAIAFLGSNSAATDKEILTTVESIATVGNQAGLSETAIVGLGGAMASLRIRPELARGAMQRVFNHLEVSARGAGDSMQILSDITGQSQDALLDLLDSGDNADQFFWTIISSLNEMYKEGTNLIPVLREMGIINTRDVDMLARLAANWDVVKDSVTSASTAYEDATYLYSESDRIFNTLTARVQLMSNAWNEFLFNAVQAIAPFITRLVEGTTAMIQFLDSINAAPVLGWSIVVLAAAAALGTLGIAGTTVVRGLLALRTAQVAVTGVFSSGTAATAANTASLLANTRSVGANTASRLAAVTSMNSFTVATNAATAGMARFTAAASAAGAAMRTLGSVLGSLAGFGALLAGVSALVLAYQDFARAADSSSESVVRANRQYLEAAGGSKALQDALAADTAAYREARDAAFEQIDALDNTTNAYSQSAQAILENSRFRVLSNREGIESDREAQQSAEDLARAQESIAGVLRDSGDSARSQADAMAELERATSGAADAPVGLFDAQERLRDATVDTTEAVQDNIVAVGLAARAYGAAVLDAALMETAAYNNAEALEVMKDAGVDLGAALTLEMANAGDGVALLDAQVQLMYDNMTTGQKTLDHMANALRVVTFGTVDLRSEQALALDATHDMSEALEAVTASMLGTVSAQDLMVGETLRLKDGTEVTAMELAEMDLQAEIMSDTITGLGISVNTLAEGFASFIDPLTAWGDALAVANDGLEDQYSSLLEVEGGFSLYLDQLETAAKAQMDWAQNLLQLSADGVPADVVAGLTEMGSEGAEIVQGLVDATDEEVARFVDLWRQGGGQVLDDFSLVFADFMVQAAQAGDQGGVDFANNLLAQVGEGEISMGEAVDRMTDYAETELDNSDPTLEFYGDATEAMEEMESLLADTERLMREANEAAVVEPTASTGGFWDSITGWWDSVKSWWDRNVRLTVNPTVSSGPAGQYGSQGRKDGGWVSGPGGPRADKIPMWLSDSEYVVNARSAKEFGPLLEWINAQHGRGSGQMVVPNFVPNDVLSSPRRPVAPMRTMAPESLYRAQNTHRSPNTPAMIVNVTNNYPQAEPTSVTVNRALATGAALNGVV